MGGKLSLPREFKNQEDRGREGGGREIEGGETLSPISALAEPFDSNVASEDAAAVSLRTSCGVSDPFFWE